MDSSTDTSEKGPDEATEIANLPLRVSLPRRFGAIIYDSIAIIALLFFATLPIVIILEGQAITAENPFYFCYLLLISFFYFAVSWTRGGQTLGMRAWKIRIYNYNEDAQTVSTKAAMKRFSFAIISWLIFGLGFLSASINENKLAWHDKFSNTHLRRCE